MAADLRFYHRRLKLASYFGPTIWDGRAKSFTAPSDWEPHSSRLPLQLLQLIKEDCAAVASLAYTPDAPNLLPEEEGALGDLISTRGIVIKPADKGSAVVIMDRADYVLEALRQLEDTEYYVPLSAPLYMETARIIREELRALLNTKAINKKQFTYLLGKSPPRPRYFYLLPKIHKASDKWTVPHRVPPGRPIVSDCGSESYGVAEYLDYYLTPLSVRHKSYIRDTPHFLAKVASLRLREPCFLFTMDVNSLYTNIEIPLGIQAVRDIFARYPDASRPDEVLLRLLDISLTRNDFVFQDRFYLQIKGTAMGKRFAPAYANIYMAAWEDTVFPTCQLLPAIYLRYLDDIWGVWTHSKAEFEAFVQTLNAHHTSITVEPEIHDTQVNFLDTTTFKGRDFERTNTLDVKLFIKPTDTHALLHRRSFHPRHVFTGILKSQLLRFSRICTQPQDRDDAMKELFAALRTRGYSRSFLRQSRKALHSSRSPPGEEEKIRLPLVVTYSSFAQKQVRALKASFAATLPGTRLARCFRLIAAYRRNPNLLKLLVRAKLPPVPTTLRLTMLTPCPGTSHGLKQTASTSYSVANAGNCT